MKNTIILVLLFLYSCSDTNDQQGVKQKESSEKENEKSVSIDVEENKIDLESIFSTIKKDIRNVEELSKHVKFPFNRGCSYLMGLENDKEAFNINDFRKAYSSIFTNEVIEKLESITLEELMLKMDEQNNVIGFTISLNFSEYIEDVDFNDEWAVIFDFLIVGNSYELICIQGAS